MQELLLPALLVAAGSAVMLGPIVRQRMLTASVQRRLAAACSGQWERSPGRWFGTGTAFGFLVPFGRLLLRNEVKTSVLVADLRAASIWHRDAAPIFAAGRALLILVGGGIAMLAWPAETFPLMLRSAALGGIVAYVLANRTLGMLAQRRARQLRIELPSAIDLIALAFEGGAGVEQALRFAATQPVHPAPRVQRMLQVFAIDLDRGTPYDLALSRLGDRLGIEEAQLLTDLLRQALQHGTELISPLKALGRDLRERRVADARAAIGRATTMMTVVMVTCLLPALLILIGAPSVGAILNVLGRYS